MKTLKALCIAYLKSVTIGFIGIAISDMLIWKYEKSTELFFQVLAFSFLNLFLSFLFALAFLLPLSAIEKEKIKSNPLMELFKRYLPFTTLPFFTLGCAIIFFNNHPSDKDKVEWYGLLMVPLILLIQTSAGLWIFLKKLKS